MWANCILRLGLLFVILTLAIAKHKQASFAKSCRSKGTLIPAVDNLLVKVAWLKASVPEDRIKNTRLLKKKTKKLFMKNCIFQERLFSFFMEDIFAQLQLQACKEIHFVEDFHSLKQKLAHCKLVLPEEKGMDHILLPEVMIPCSSSAKELKSITRIKRTFYRMGKKGVYKAISELDILLSWIKNFLESILL